jgi:hypothetical protein
VQNGSDTEPPTRLLLQLVRGALELDPLPDEIVYIDPDGKTRRLLLREALRELLIFRVKE